MPSNHWTEDEIEQLRRLHHEGVTFKHISRMLNRPVQGIRGKARQLGLRRRASHHIEYRQFHIPVKDKFLEEINEAAFRQGVSAAHFARTALRKAIDE